MTNALQCQLDRRPRRPFRGLPASIAAALWNRPRLLGPLLQYVVPALQRFADPGPYFVVATHRDMREIMERDDDFPIGPQIDPAMVCGAFVLGIDRRPFLREDLVLLWEAFYEHTSSNSVPPGGSSSKVRLPSNAKTQIETVSAKVKKIIAAAEQGDGRLDLVQQVIRPACEWIVQDHLGIGPPDDGWIKALWDVLGILALRIILPGKYDMEDIHDPVVAELIWAKEALRLAIVEGIDAAASAGGRAPANIIAKMYDVLASKKPTAPPEALLRDTIIRNISGLAITGCHPIARAAAQAVDVLLANPPAFRGATAAATAGDKDLFWDFIEEALRFFPPIPVVARACPRATVIGVDTGRPRKVRAGQSVTVGLLPAMFDPAAVPFPYQFRTDRARDDSLVFGRGLRGCFGYQFVKAVLIAVLMPLFVCGFDRAPGREGKLSFDSVLPRSLQLRLSPPGIGAAKC
jgi:cytochrome P450